MLRAFCIIALASSILATSNANPIAIDSQRRPATMISEKVTIAVSRNCSTVTGYYTFREGVDDWPVEKDTHVLIYIPVLLSPEWDKKYESQFGTPIVTIHGRKFISHQQNDLSQDDHPNPVKLPKGWFMSVYEVRIPLNLITAIFQIEINYTQPTFPGQIAGYVPMLPPQNPSSSEILFVAPENGFLRETGFFSAFQRKTKQLGFKPENRILLAVRLHN